MPRFEGAPVRDDGSERALPDPRCEPSGNTPGAAGPRFQALRRRSEPRASVARDVAGHRVDQCLAPASEASFHGSAPDATVVSA